MHRLGWVLVLAMCAGCSGRVQTTATGSGAGGEASSGSAGGTCATGGSGASCAGGAADTAATTGTTGASGTLGAGGTAGATSASTGGGELLRPCLGHVYACGDTLDNDGDGLIDAADPGCTGACDNDEASHYPGIPDTFWTCPVDCYFDPDGGSGNDDCHWSIKCDPHEVPPLYYPGSEFGAQCAYDPQTNVPGTTGSCADLMAAQSPACMTYCGPLTPNGCDCFGCCEFPAGSGNDVWLGSSDSIGNGTCDPAGLLDPAKCHPCQRVASCFNSCDTCELCIGQASLPAGCTEQPCAGATPCGLAGQPPCPAGFYCVTGCCQPLPF